LRIITHLNELIEHYVYEQKYSFRDFSISRLFTPQRN
jgi:hypothetical protein